MCEVFLSGQDYITVFVVIWSIARRTLCNIYLSLYGDTKSAYIELLGVLAASHTITENPLKSLESAFFPFKIRVFIVQERIR